MGTAATVVVVTVARVVVVARSAAKVRGGPPAFATDRFGGRTVTTGDALVWKSPNHSNGPTTNMHSRGPRANRLMRSRVRRCLRANHSKRVIDGSYCSSRFMPVKKVPPRRANCHAATTAS